MVQVQSIEDMGAYVKLVSGATASVLRIIPDGYS